MSTAWRTCQSRSSLHTSRLLRPRGPRRRRVPPRPGAARSACRPGRRARQGDRAGRQWRRGRRSPPPDSACRGAARRAQRAGHRCAHPPLAQGVTRRLDHQGSGSPSASISTRGITLRLPGPASPTVASQARRRTSGERSATAFTTSATVSAPARPSAPSAAARTLAEGSSASRRTAAASPRWPATMTARSFSSASAPSPEATGRRPVPWQDRGSPLRV